VETRDDGSKIIYGLLKDLLKDLLEMDVIILNYVKKIEKNLIMNTNEIYDIEKDNIKIHFNTSFFTVHEKEVEKNAWDIINEKNVFLECFTMIDEINKMNFVNSIDKIKIISEKPILIIKNNSVVLNEILFPSSFYELNDKFDLIFLSNCKDYCDIYRNVEGYNYLKQTAHPTSTQGIIFFPSAVKKIMSKKDEIIHFSDFLNQMISEKELTSATYIPNIIAFDYRYATKIEDFQNLNQCDIQYGAEDEDPYKYIWLTMIIILYVFVVLYYLKICFVN